MRRVFRLVPAMWLAILLAYVIAQWRGIPSGVNLGMFGKTLILQDLSLMVPLWSLNVEIGCSLVFPLLYAFGRRFGLFCNLGILLVLAALIYRTPSPMDLRIEFARYLVFFQTGLMAGTWGVALWERVGVVARWSALGAAVVIFGLVPQLWAFRSTYPIYADERNWLMLELPCCFIILVYAIAGCGRRETACCEVERHGSLAEYRLASTCFTHRSSVLFTSYIPTTRIGGFLDSGQCPWSCCFWQS